MTNQVKISKNNIIIAIIVVVVLAICVYWYFSSSGSSSSSDDVLSSSAAASSDTLLSTLDQLKSLTLDQSITTNPEFESLTDNTVVLPTENAGKQNPFAPLGPASTTTTSH